MVSTIAKEALKEMPIETFPGRIILIQNTSDADKASEYLRKFDILGFDTETRPNFKKGVRNKIALIQLSTEETCFLFRLNLMEFPESLADILSANGIKKIGLSLKDDFSAIQKSKPLKPDNFLELQTFVKKYGIEDNGLQRIYGILFGKRITKGQRLTNWNAEILTDAQKMYAALDAWACLRIYNELTGKN